MTDTKPKKPKKRPMMIGNQNRVQEIVKDDSIYLRIRHEDKLKLKHYCSQNNISQADLLINCMVDLKILPEERRIETKSK